MLEANSQRAAFSLKEDILFTSLFKILHEMLMNEQSYRQRIYLE